MSRALFGLAALGVGAFVGAQLCGDASPARPESQVAGEESLRADGAGAHGPTGDLHASPEDPTQPEAPSGDNEASPPLHAEVAPVTSNRQPSLDPFCPGADDSPTGFIRPTLSAILNVPLAALEGRSRNGSPASETLREAYGLLAGFMETSAALTPETRPSVGSASGWQAVELFREAPDRVHESTDLALAAGLAVVGRALANDTRARDRGESLEHAQQVSETLLATFPTEPLAWIQSALVHRIAGADRGSRDALGKAMELGATQSAVLRERGRLLTRTTELGEASDLLSRYLEREPGDLDAARLKARVDLQLSIQETYGIESSERVTVWHGDSLSTREARELAHDTERALEDAAYLLNAPVREELLVVVYDDRSELVASSCVPGWTGGLFDGVLRISADNDDERRGQTLRHEAFHAQLGRWVRSSPYWFNEGAAQWFAHESSAAHERSFELIRSGVRIPFASLEGSFLAIDDASDAGLAYHQSLAMVNGLVALRGERVFADAFQWLRRGSPSQGLLDRLLGGRTLEL